MSGIGGVNISTVVGIDGNSPVYNPDNRWQTWYIDEIYLGTVGLNKYVPKVKDLIYTVDNNKVTVKIVTFIDSVTLIPTLVNADFTSNLQNLSTAELLLGVEGEIQSDTYRVYLDRSVTPHRLTVDARLRISGTMCRWVKIFLGADVSSASGTVISRMYDSGGVLLSENVPLELVQTSGVNNLATKVVSPCYTNYNLADGELVTAVVYDDAGFVISKRQLLIENTAFIRSTDRESDFIISIRLKSPYIAGSNSRLIQFPAGATMNSLNLTGVITYRSGRVVEMPVDGTKFSIFGLENYVSSIVGEKVPVILKYNLSSSETTYIATEGGATSYITEEYEAQTAVADSAYSLKLFVYPYWVSPIVGYQLQWFLYNLQRNISYNVTSNVRINQAISSFNPNVFGTLQRLNVSVNIHDVDSTFAQYNHVQIVDVILSKLGTERLNNWAIGYSPSQQPKYGIDTFATGYNSSSNNWTIKLDMGLSSQAAWLERLYSRTQPLYDPSSESAAPVPNFFTLTIEGVSREYSVSQWNSALTFIGAPVNNSTIYIKFFKRMANNDLQLAVAGLPFYQVNQAGNYI